MKRITLSGSLFLLLICCRSGSAVTKRIEAARNSPHRLTIGDIRVTLLDLGYSDEDQFDETEIIITLISKETSKACEVVSLGSKIKSFDCSSIYPEEDVSTLENAIQIYFNGAENEVSANVKSALVALTYNDSLRLDIYCDDDYVAPNNAESIQDIFRLHSGDEDWNLERHMPRLESEVSGDNYFIKSEKTVFLLLHHGMELVIQPVPVLDFSLLIPYPKDELHEYFAIENLLSLLKLPKEYITITGAECMTSKKTQLVTNDTYLLLQVEVGTSPRLTPGNVGREQLDLKSLSKNLTTVFQSGDPEKWFSNSVYFLNIENESVSPDRLVNCSKVGKRFRRESDNRPLPPQSEDSIIFEGHKLVLRPASEYPPSSVMSKEKLLPAPGVVVYDETDQKYASGELFKNVSWSATVRSKYNFYIGNLAGTTGLQITGNYMILFEDLTITGISYNHYLLITVSIKGRDDSAMTYTIGPFGVRTPGSIQYKDYAKIKFKYNGDYNKVTADKRKFEAFMPNFYGKLYPSVSWEYLESMAGSVVAEMKMTGPPDKLKDESKNVVSRKDPLKYEGEEWKVQSAEVIETSLNLAKREAGTAEATESTTEDGGGDDEPEKKSGFDALPNAWIAAIVINGVLVLLFIGFVIYCYCKSKKSLHTHCKAREEGTDRLLTGSASSVHMMEKSFDGPPDRMYNEKAANLPGNEKAALLDHSVFTVEDEKRRMEDDDADRYSTPINGRSSSRDPRCTCGTPECCCGQRDTPFDKRYTTPPPPMTVRQEYPEPEEEEPINYGKQRQNDVGDPWNPPTRTFSASSRNHLNDSDYLPGAISPIDDPEEPIIPPPPPPVPEKQEKKYYVYLVTDSYGSRDCIGHVMLPNRDHMTLTQLRNYVDDAEPPITDVIAKDYLFVTEDFEDITQQEGSLIVNRVYPSQTINLRLIEEAKPHRENHYTNNFSKPKPLSIRRNESKKKPPPYVGPLGICGAAECENAARIKCLDCGNTAYCGTRCMRLDLNSHRKTCFSKNRRSSPNLN